MISVDGENRPHKTVGLFGGKRKGGIRPCQRIESGEELIQICAAQPAFFPVAFPGAKEPDLRSFHDIAEYAALRDSEFKPCRQIAHFQALPVGIILIEKQIIRQQIRIENRLVRKLRFQIGSVLLHGKEMILSIREIQASFPEAEKVTGSVIKHLYFGRCPLRGKDTADSRLPVRTILPEIIQPASVQGEILRIHRLFDDLPLPDVHAALPCRIFHPAQERLPRGIMPGAVQKLLLVDKSPREHIV